VKTAEEETKDEWRDKENNQTILTSLDAAGKSGNANQHRHCHVSQVTTLNQVQSPEREAGGTVVSARAWKLILARTGLAYRCACALNHKNPYYPVVYSAVTGMHATRLHCDRVVL